MSLGHGPVIAKDGLVLHLDAANPKSYPGTGTTWFDLSGNGNDATLSGVFSSTENSIVLNSGESNFSGDGRATIDFGTASASPHTIEVTFRINRYGFLASTTNIAIQLFSSGRAVGNFDEAFYIASNGVSGEVQSTEYAWYDAGAADGGGPGTPLPVQLNNTYISTVTIENPGNVTFYVNGIARTVDTTIASNLKLDDIWCVGNQPPGVDNGVDSSFYSIRVYNRALSAQEVAQNFEAMRGRYGI